MDKFRKQELLSNIILVGMMGCGKSSVGQAISQRASMLFIDTDVMIEERLKMTIPHIFEQYGESYFRSLEAETAFQISTSTNTVIATGGGIIINPHNMTLLKASGFIVYLRCNPQQLYERTTGDRNRPLQNRLEELLIQREPLYAKYSDLIIDSDKATVAGLSEMILNEYSSYKRA